MIAHLPKVSIIVPIYNVRMYIERCALSLFEQTYNNIEYIFVNDCTKDNSVHVLEEVISRYSNRKQSTRIITHDKNRGIAATRNTGVKNCTGDFVVYVDSDDYLEPNAIELLVNQQLKSNADIVSGMALMHTANRDILLQRPFYRSKEEMVQDMMQTTINHSLWGRLIRKSLFDDYSITAKEGVNCGEDCWVMTQLAYYAKSFDTIDQVVYHYDCTRDDSYTASKKGVLNKKKIKDDIATDELIIDFFKDKEPVYYDEANRVAIRYLDLFLKIAVSEKNFGVFDEMRTRLKAFDKKYWAAIGWDKSYKRALSQNYHSLKAALFLKKVLRKIL